MALLTHKDDESEESLMAKLRQAKADIEAGRMTRAEYDELTVQLEAQLALLDVQPTLDANAEARLADLDYLRSKGWISDEEYQSRKKEIFGQD